ncbi:hypothetical protein CTEN210_09971 [Chaetoceros tenuissimus]|uniref:Uncharacterized protein n=1 Tax=Chaetoceros tenuissimus TaxID=426638 RepID=A0AAD3H7Q8_9STRA|nr:hypothetical protein CTEN210_09971 [Chaetoceros tenuissimus]
MKSPSKRDSKTPKKRGANFTSPAHKRQRPAVETIDQFKKLDARQSNGALINKDVTKELQLHVKKSKYWNSIMRKVDKEYTPVPKLQVKENDSDDMKAVKEYAQESEREINFIIKCQNNANKDKDERIATLTSKCEELTLANREAKSNYLKKEKKWLEDETALTLELTRATTTAEEEKRNILTRHTTNTANLEKELEKAQQQNKCSEKEITKLTSQVNMLSLNVEESKKTIKDQKASLQRLKQLLIEKDETIKDQQRQLQFIQQHSAGEKQPRVETNFEAKERKEVTTVQLSAKRSEISVSSQAISEFSDSFQENESNSSAVEIYGDLTDEMSDSSESKEEVDESTFLVPVVKSATEKLPFSEVMYMLIQKNRELQRENQLYKRERRQAIEMNHLDQMAVNLTNVSQDILYTLASCGNVALEGFLQDSIPMVNIGGGDVPELIVDMNKNNEVGTELLQNKVYVSELKKCMSARNNRFPVLPTGKLKGKNVFLQANHREEGYMETEGIIEDFTKVLSSILGKDVGYAINQEACRFLPYDFTEAITWFIDMSQTLGLDQEHGYDPKYRKAKAIVDEVLLQLKMFQEDSQYFSERLLPVAIECLEARGHEFISILKFSTDAVEWLLGSQGKTPDILQKVLPNCTIAELEAHLSHNIQAGGKIASYLFESCNDAAIITYCSATSHIEGEVRGDLATKSSLSEAEVRADLDTKSSLSEHYDDIVSLRESLGAKQIMTKPMQKAKADRRKRTMSNRVNDAHMKTSVTMEARSGRKINLLPYQMCTAAGCGYKRCQSKYCKGCYRKKFEQDENGNWKPEVLCATEGCNVRKEKDDLCEGCYRKKFEQDENGNWKPEFHCATEGCEARKEKDDLCEGCYRKKFEQDENGNWKPEFHCATEGCEARKEKDDLCKPCYRKKFEQDEQDNWKPEVLCATEGCNVRKNKGDLCKKCYSKKFEQDENGNWKPEFHCATEGCNVRKRKQDLCEGCYRKKFEQDENGNWKPEVLCATEGCNVRKNKDDLCKPCYRKKFEQDENGNWKPEFHCATEGCEARRVTGGICLTCKRKS